jgi:hypothetical protein
MRARGALWGLVLGGAFTLLPAGQARAGLIVVPNANATAPGNIDNRFPFLVDGGMRYQQVFASSQFSAFGGGPQLITEMDLRNGIFLNQAFTATIPSINISLSTTALPPDGLSSTFANNTGTGTTLVYSGPLTLSSTNAAGPGGTHVFDVAIHFQTPFLYDPTQGNLLLDVDNLSGATSNVGTDFFDAVNVLGDSVSRVFGPEGSPAATSGTPDSFGLIAQFQFGAATAVPEPASLTLLSLGALSLLGYGWRKRKPA